MELGPTRFTRRLAVGKATQFRPMRLTRQSAAATTTASRLVHSLPAFRAAITIALQAALLLPAREPKPITPARLSGRIRRTQTSLQPGQTNSSSVLGAEWASARLLPPQRLTCEVTSSLVRAANCLAPVALRTCAFYADTSSEQPAVLPKDLALPQYETPPAATRSPLEMLFLVDLQLRLHR